MLEIKKYKEVPYQAYQQNEHNIGKNEPIERSIEIIQTETKGENRKRGRTTKR